jgi:hypothetical protein
MKLYMTNPTMTIVLVTIGPPLRLAVLKTMIPGQKLESRTIV